MATYRLVVRSGPMVGKEFLIQKNEITIGRDLNNDVVISDSEVSRRHARLYLQGSTYVVEDLGSTNGTAVDGQRLMGPYVLRPGEIIGLGERNTLVYELVQVDADATVAAAAAARPAAVRPAAVPPPVSTPPPVYQPSPPPPQPQYAGQVPGYQEVEEYEEPKKKFPIWVVILIVVILLLICVCAGALWYIDSNFLWCTVMPFLGGCSP